MVPRKAGEASPKGVIFEVALEEETEEGKADNRECAKAQQGGGRKSWRAWTRLLKPEAGSKDGGVSHLIEGLTCQVEKLRFILETTRSLWRPGRRGGTWATRCDAQSQVQTTEDKSKGQISQCKRECLTHSSPGSRALTFPPQQVCNVQGSWSEVLVCGLFHQISFPEATLKKPRRPPASGVFAACFEVGVGGEKDVFQKIP